MVSSVAERGTKRLRARLADDALDKEASLATGVVTPAASVLAAAMGSGTGRASQGYVGEEALLRIEESFLPFSPATRAGVRAAVAAKSADNDAAYQALLAEVRAHQGERPVLRLAELLGKAADTGLKLKLSASERNALAKAVEDGELSATVLSQAYGGTRRMVMMRTRRPDPAAAPRTARGFTPNAASLASYMAAHKYDLVARAKASRGGAVPERAPERPAVDAPADSNEKPTA